MKQNRDRRETQTAADGRDKTHTAADDWGKALTATIGANIRELRSKQGWSANDLSKATENLGFQVARNTISNLENGRKTSVAVAELLAISQALDIPLGALIASPLHPTSPVQLAPTTKIPAVLAYRKIAPDFLETQRSNLNNDTRRAIRATQQFQDQMETLESRRAELSELYANAEATNEPIDPNAERIALRSIESTQAFLETLKINFALLGVTPWTLPDVGVVDE